MGNTDGKRLHTKSMKFFLPVLLATLLAFLLELGTDASLVSEVFRSLAARMFAPYASYFYGLGVNATPTTERLIVVDVGVPTLQRYRASGHLTYGQHARLLERIRVARPRAVFIDFQFQSDRVDSSLEQLTDTLCAFHDDGIPVYMSVGSEANEGRLRREIETLQSKDGKACFQKVGVAYRPSEIDRIVWSYPLMSRVGGVSRPSAALAMATQIHGENLQEAHSSHMDMGITWGSGSKETGPNWGASTDEVHDQNEIDEQKHYCRIPTWRDLVSLNVFLTHELRLVKDSRPICPLHESVEAARLTEPKTQEQYRQLDDSLNQRLVFYGGSYDANDFINTPLHDQIPGVYLHAQATDNLLRYGANWRRSELSMTLAFFVFFCVSFGFVSMRAMLRYMLNVITTHVIHFAPVITIKKFRDHLKQRHSKTNRGLTHKTIRVVAKVFKNLGRQIGLFFIGLLIAIPMSWMMEQLFRVSVIGYGSILAFCLMGEVFVNTTEIDGEFESKSN